VGGGGAGGSGGGGGGGVGGGWGGGGGAEAKKKNKKQKIKHTKKKKKKKKKKEQKKKQKKKKKKKKKLKNNKKKNKTQNKQKRAHFRFRPPPAQEEVAMHATWNQSGAVSPVQNARNDDCTPALCDQDPSSPFASPAGIQTISTQPERSTSNFGPNPHPATSASPCALVTAMGIAPRER